MAPTFEETRQYERVRPRMTVRMALLDKLVQVCPVRDLGPGGIYVLVTTRLRPWQTCTMDLQLISKSDGPKIEAKGQVLRVEPGRGAALQFTDLSLEAFDRLDRIVFDAAPKPPPPDMRRRHS